MNSLKNKNIIFLSLGSYTTKKDLIYSQMVKFADELESQNIFKSVKSIVVLPKLSTYRRYKTHKNNVNDFYNSISSKLIFCYSWLLSGKMYSFIMKDFFYKLLKTKIYDEIDTLEGEIIFHCRSYYATDFALYLKKKYPNKNIKVVFDMRSLLPPEFPYTSKLFGKFLYVQGKEWERKLLKSSDLSLVVTKNAINLLHLEDSTYENINYIPIIGFSDRFKSIDKKSEFENRWKNKSFGYVGSIGLWHNLESIELVESTINSFQKNSKFIIATGNKHLDTYIDKVSIPNDEMPIFYKKQLAIVIPGVLKNIDYFKSLQMTSNLFSTKASEALSLGVPLIVNKQISELANLVLEKKCGLVFEYDLEKDKIRFINATENDLISKDFWESLTDNAFELSKEFSKERTEKMYLDYWNNI